MGSAASTRLRPSPGTGGKKAESTARLDQQLSKTIAEERKGQV
eukprot:COSAG04_NODE_26414_length_295_cov_0.780612_2_plen_42_part_01